ncbi:MAG: ECF-type sigma factor, partial [Solirubrobacteraceae bacterium]|nr:ECF-type sigma factor [Solirubrobacteraceae bacterium]
PERGAAASWLFGIAQNVLGHSMRRRRVDDAARRRLAFDHDRLDAETRTAIEALHAEDAVNSMLQALPLDQRDAVRARILDGTPYDELAVDLACSPMVARKRVSRGLATLRAQLKGTP